MLRVIEGGRPCEVYMIYNIFIKSSLGMLARSYGYL